MARGVGAEEGGWRREDGGGGDDAVGGGGGWGRWRVGAGTDQVRSHLDTSLHADGGNIQHLHVILFIYIFIHHDTLT